MKTRSAQVLIHVIGCIAFLALPVLVSPDLMRPSELFDIPPFRRDFLFYVLLTGFFYLSFFVLVPRFFLSRQFWLFGLLLLGCFLVAVFLPELIVPRGGGHQPPPGASHDMRPPGPGGPPQMRDTMYKFFTFLVVTFFSLVIRINRQWRQTQQEQKESELSYLKAQINPHFLFNTLNSIYSLAITKSDETPKAIVKLSGMMRYVISDASADFVPLEKEITYVSDFVDLQRIRLGNTVALSYEVSGKAGDKRIAPLLLIPFVENAFKHGVNPEENSNIHIRIDMDEIGLRLLVVNNKVSERIHDKTGIGVDTTSHRLKLSYPSRHQLQIESTEKTHSVSLHLRLK